MEMFPFNLPGPQFLLFYIVFAAAVLAALYFARLRFEQGTPGSIDLQDPFVFACLRGGPTEVVRVATMGLIDRGLLQVAGSGARPSPQAGADSVRRPLERGIMHHFARSAELLSVLTAPGPLRAADEYEAQLRRGQLVPDPGIESYRSLAFGAALAALIGVGGTKLLVALGQGRGNVGFLVALLVVAGVVAWKLVFKYRTVAGDSALASMRSMFDHLRTRTSSIRPGSGSRELLWLTALFGAAAVPAAAFPFVQHFKKKNEGGTSCGSSCGGGSSGCGGGGGGCGGCGS
jgi:uncharacterized protein (TIGR04222 family)